MLADDAPAPLPPAATADDLGVRPLHLGLDRPAQGGDALARQRLRVPRLVRRRPSASARDDRFASHAPFHFDLSVFDLFASCRLRGDARPDRRGARQGPRAARAVPGRAADRRLVLGPVDPRPAGRARRARAGRRHAPRGWSCSRARSSRSRPLKRLRALWPAPTLWNLYGPTETNVCTAFPIPEAIPDDRADPVPDRPRLPAAPGPGGRRGRAATCPPASVGELVIAGPGVMRGYFGRPDLTARAFSATTTATRWYRTGDLVADDGGGLLPVPRPPRPDGQEARLPDRAGRDRVGPLPPRRGRPRRRGRQGRRRRASRSPRSSP